jgi:hypothetical protein
VRTISIQPVLVRLTPCRRKLLEARRTKDDFSTAKRKYDQDRDKIQLVLDTWTSEQQKQIQTNRQVLERASKVISTKADGFINNAIEKTLRECNFGTIRSGDGRQEGGKEVSSKEPVHSHVLKESPTGNQGSRC